MELLHYSFQFHNPTTQQHDLEPVFAIHFHSQFFLRLVHPRPELVPSTAASAVLRLPGHLLRRSGPASIGALLSRLGVSDDLVRFLEPEIFRTVVAVSCGASNVGLVAVEIWAATPYDDVEEIDRALRELGEEYAAAVGAVPAASDLGIEGLERVGVGIGIDRCCCCYGGEECAICLGDLGSGAIRLPCKHVYHQDCIVKWLKNKNVCPLCRSSIRLNMS